MTNQVAWFHPFSGIAGDMTLGALLDAGADLDFVVATLDGLNVDGWALTTEQVDRNGIRATRAVVDAPEQHHHRHWTDIRSLLEEADIPDRVKSRSLAVFEVLAVAEGNVHGVSPEEVHFHEVGALDAIVDIVGSCAALESLDIDEITSGPLPDMTITASGYGAGTRDLPDRANVTQVIIGTATPTGGTSEDPTETVVELATNLDDITGEQLGHAITELMEAGALDAWVTPIVMKKGRPAHTLSVLVTPPQAAELAGLVMSMTGSLGVRTRQLDRVVAQRHTVTVSVDGHDIDVKVSDVRVKAEFDQVTVAAEALGLPVQEVAARAEHLARDL